MLDTNGLCNRELRVISPAPPPIDPYMVCSAHCSHMIRVLTSYGWSCYPHTDDTTQFRVYIGTAPPTRDEIRSVKHARDHKASLATLRAALNKRWYLCFSFPVVHATNNTFETVLMNSYNHLVSVPDAGYAHTRAFLNYPIIAHRELERVCAWMAHNRESLNTYYVSTVDPYPPKEREPRLSMWDADSRR